MMFTYVMCSKQCLTRCKPLIRVSSDGDDNDDDDGGGDEEEDEEEEENWPTKWG